MRNTILSTGAMILCFLVAALGTTEVYAINTTVPQRIVYNGHLLKSNGSPISSPHTIRFSFWNSADFVAGDTTAGGAVNTAAATYEGWTEVHTVTPNSEGYFTVELGSITPIPGIETFSKSTLLSMYIQLEVKKSANPDTAYELMDVDASDDSNDRSSVLSVPFAMNADFIDQREIGTGSGDIAILEEGGVFNISAIPGGTNSGAFTIDFNDTEATTISLHFGNTLNRFLEYNIAGDYFRFNSDLQISGNLTVTGLINGIDISTLTSSNDTYLKVASGAGLNVSVGGGSYRINGIPSNFGGSGSMTLTDNSTNYIYITDGGLTYNTTGFPSDESYLQLGEVITAAGTITSVTDRRILMDDDRENVIIEVFNPIFEGASLQADASDNVGRLFVDHDGTNRKNFYHWTSTKTALQDYDILVTHQLPDGFTEWDEDGTIQLDYRTTDAAATQNKIDISIFDTNGTPVTLSGSTTDLTSTSWATTRIEYTGSPTWTAGEDITIRLRVFAKDDDQAHIGNLQMKYKALSPQ